LRACRSVAQVGEDDGRSAREGVIVSVERNPRPLKPVRLKYP